MGYALLIYIAYLNLMVITRAKLADETLPPVVNFWWVHALFVVLACALLYRRSRGLMLMRSAS
jgi:lipopolysaccharide export LptBFGC system permease protein LptF